MKYYRHHRQTGYQPRGRSNFPKRRVRSFDPTVLVKSSASRPSSTAKRYTPQHTFAGFTLSDQLHRNIATKGYQELTPVQDQVIPQLLLGKDVVGIASTGTGKTAAFLIPGINKVASDRAQRVLIVTPTRELAAQIEQELRSLARNMNIFSAVCIGGVRTGGQISDLRRNPNFVVGTPGRLKDLERQRWINFSSFKTLVLDEVDRMLDMGFIHDVTQIVSALPADRQTAFFSATLSDKVRHSMHQFLRHPVMISIESAHSMANITQDIVKVQGREKVQVLHELLVQKGLDKVLVFGRTKWGLEKLARELLMRGCRVTTIHGNKNQHQRQRSLDEFKSNRVRVLLATDVASRGLDVQGVTHVINFDLPETYEDYVHRIGRTGRANSAGVALTFVD